MISRSDLSRVCTVALVGAVATVVVAGGDATVQASTLTHSAAADSGLLIGATHGSALLDDEEMTAGETEATVDMEMNSDMTMSMDEDTDMGMSMDAEAMPMTDWDMDMAGDTMDSTEMADASAD